MTPETIEALKFIVTTWGGPGAVIAALAWSYYKLQQKHDAERNAHLETVRTVMPALTSNTTSNNEVAKALEKVSAAVKAQEDNVYELLRQSDVSPRRPKRTEG